MSRVSNRARIAIAATLLVCCVLAASSSAAWATTPGVGWEASSSAYPTDLPPGGTGRIDIYLMNTGAAPSTGPITVTDTLPSGVIATAAGGFPNNEDLGVEGTNEIPSLKEEKQAFGGPRW